jgi:hypothetical protein
MSLKRKRLSPAAGKSLRKTLSRHPEGAAVGLTLWPRTREGRLGPRGLPGGPPLHPP